MIVYNHTAGFFFLPAHSALADLRHVVYLGMTLFFVLSGFVIHFNYGAMLTPLRAEGVRGFLVARFARLYPLYLLALAAMLAFSAPPELTANWLWCLTATHAWLPLRVGDQWLAGVAQGSWSISVEILLYLLYLPFAARLSRLSRRQTLTALGVLVASMSLFYGGHAGELWFASIDQTWWFYFGAYCRIPEFAVGALTAQLYLRQPASPSLAERRVATAVAAAAVCWSAVIYIGVLIPSLEQPASLAQRSGAYAWPCAAIIYYAARFGMPALTAPATLRLGEASYSMYLLHGWILWMFSSQGIGSGYFFWTKVAVAWIIIAMLSLGSYTYFERPMRSWLRSLLSNPIAFKADRRRIAP